jgi:hypothetical protein
MTSPLRRKRPITVQLPQTTSKSSRRGLRRAAWAASALALALAHAADAPRARGSEEAFRPVVPTVAATTSAKPASSLRWRARGTSSAQEPKQLAAKASDAFRPIESAEPTKAEPAVVAASAVEPKANDKVPAGMPVEVNRISSKQSRARMRDSVMQVGAYQDAAAPPFGETPPADTPSADALRDPFEGQAPMTTPPDTTSPDALPPAMPTDTDPPALPGNATAPSDDPPPPVDELFKDQPIREPDAPAQLPQEMREQLLDEGLSTAPGGPACENQKEECQRAIAELQKRDITTVTVGLLIEGVEGTDFPCDCRLGRDYDAPAFAGRNFAPTLFTWKATGTCHKPLYFEDVQLERYGHSWNPVLQPFVSGAHFFVSVPLLPYKMGLRPPNECVYTLGYYRPGNCAPYMFEPIPLSLRAAASQAAGMTAFAFWFWPPN